MAGGKRRCDGVFYVLRSSVSRYGGNPEMTPRTAQIERVANTPLLLTTEVVMEPDEKCGSMMRDSRVIDYSRRRELAKLAEEIANTVEEKTVVNERCLLKNMVLNLLEH